MGDEPFDEVAFDTWLAGDPRRRSAFDAMWRRVMGPEIDAASRAYERRRSSKRTLLASCMAILLIGVGGYRAIPLVELRLAPPQEYAVADGKVRDITLEDGTQLTLAGGADVKVRYTRHDRVLELAHGTIFADVAHDERRPFRVDTGDARILVLGTSFEVLSKPGNVRVTVASGAVQFGRNDWFSKPITLDLKQVAVLDQTGLNRIANVNPDSIAPWRREWMEYKGAPLLQVIADLQTLSPQPIRIADESLANRPVSGRIRLTDPIGQIENLSIIHEFKVRHEDDALVITMN